MKLRSTHFLQSFDAIAIGIIAFLAMQLYANLAVLSLRVTSELATKTLIEARNQGIPQSKHSQTVGKYAYATLCFGDATVSGTRVLFRALHRVGADADFVALTNNLSSTSINQLSRSNIKIVRVEPLYFNKFYMTSRKRPQTEQRDAILWSKLRAWQLTDYDKVIMLDSDLLVLKNVDELFLMPEVSASAMVHTAEKISFFKTSEYGMRAGNKIDRKSRDPSLLEGWSGLNSGVTVLKPSNTTFENLLTELSIVPNRPCCPSQEFLYNYFEERRQYFRLPPVYNARSIAAAGGGGSDSDDLEATAAALKQHMKIYHFVGTKPWKKRDSSAMNQLWWKYADELTDLDAKLGKEAGMMLQSHEYYLPDSKDSEYELDVESIDINLEKYEPDDNALENETHPESFDLALIDECLRNDELSNNDTHAKTSPEYDRSKLDFSLDNLGGEGEESGHFDSRTPVRYGHHEASVNILGESEVPYISDNEEDALELDANEISQLDDDGDRHLSPDPSPLRQMLQDAMDKIEQLTKLNEALEGENSANAKAIEELNKEANESAFAHAMELERIKADHEASSSSLKSTIDRLETQLTAARSSTQQLSALCESLKQDKDMDILNLRVELMSEKEQQLHDLKERFELEKSRLRSQFQSDILSTNQNADNERIRLQIEIHSLKSELKQTEKKMSKKTVNVSVQVDDTEDYDSLKKTMQDIGRLFRVEHDENIFQVVESYVSDTQAQLASARKDLSDTDSKMIELQQLIQKLQDQCNQFEENNTLTIQSLQQSHETSVLSLKQAHAHQIQVLTERLNSSLDQNSIKSWTELELHFPHLFADFRTHVKKLVDLDHADFIQKLKQTVQDERRSLNIVFKKAIENERDKLAKRYDAEIEAATKDIKAQCAAAYESAVSKLKEEYIRLEKSCMEKFSIEAWIKTEQELRQVLKNQEAYIAALESEQNSRIEELRLEYDSNLKKVKDDARTHYSNQLRHALERMKDRYIQTLRAAKRPE